MHSLPTHIDEWRQDSPPAEKLRTHVPLLLPEVSADFTWHGKAGTIFAQRATFGSDRPSEEAFYLRSPDGTFHEISYREVRRHLTRTPLTPTVSDIALSFEKEPDQWEPDHLPQLLILCRP